MGDKEDYLTSYRVFFENFAATVNPEDQLPVQIAGYTITKAELPGEVLYWTTQYLTEKQCPLTLMTPLRRIILDEVQVASKKHPNEFGYKSDESVYIALRLMQAVTARVNHVCLRYLDNSQLDTLPPPPPLAQRDLKTVSCATKNSRRVMEDRHVEIGNLESLFGIETTEPTSFYAVYDGHAGSAAATYCAAHLHQYLVESPHFTADLRRAMRDAFLRTDAEFIRKSNQERACGGSTAVCVCVRSRRLLAAWAGDSQALLAKRMRLMQLVHPHKPGRQDEKERIESSGGTVMYWGTWRVNGQLAVSRAIGDAQYKPYVTARPEIATVDLDGDEDFVVVACDGLWDFVSEDDIALAVYRQLAADPDDLKAVTKRLIVQAKRQGSADNISIIVVFLKDPRDIVADNCPPMDLGLDNALANVPPFAVDTEACKRQVEAATAAATTAGECNDADAEAEADAGDNGVDNFDSGSEDLGPETAVDADDIDAEAKNHEPAPPTPPAHTVEEGHVDGALVDNVAESGEESEDEWNYFKGEGERDEHNPNDEPEEPPHSETPCQDNSAWENSSVDMNSSPLNPEAPVFVPGSVAGADVLLAESPRKPLPMDDIELPDVAQFETEADIRPAELLDLDNCDQLNGHHNVSLNESVKEPFNGNDDRCNMDSLGFGFNVGIEPEKIKDTGLIQDFERIQKDTTDFCNIQVFQTHTETNPFDNDGNDELFERLKNKERDPMSMSFYQEKDDDTCERLSKNESLVDLNAVQTLPDSDDEEMQQNGVCENVKETDKENLNPVPPRDLYDTETNMLEPNNDIMVLNDKTEALSNNLCNLQEDNFVDYNITSSEIQSLSNMEFENSNIAQDPVLQTDTPESHKLLFEQIPEIPDGKSSELGFTNDDIQDPSESEKDTTVITPQDEISQNEIISKVEPATEEEQTEITDEIHKPLDAEHVEPGFIIKSEEVDFEVDQKDNRIDSPLETQHIECKQSQDIISPELKQEIHKNIEVDIHHYTETPNDVLSEVDNMSGIPEIKLDTDLPEMQINSASSENAYLDEHLVSEEICESHEILQSESLAQEESLVLKESTPSQSPLPTESPLLDDHAVELNEVPLSAVTPTPIEDITASELSRSKEAIHTEDISTSQKSPLPTDISIESEASKSQSPLPSQIAFETNEITLSTTPLLSEDNITFTDNISTIEQFEPLLKEHITEPSEASVPAKSPVPNESEVQNELPEISFPVDVSEPIVLSEETNLTEMLLTTHDAQDVLNDIVAEDVCLDVRSKSPLPAEVPLPRESPVPAESPAPAHSPALTASPIPVESELRDDSNAAENSALVDTMIVSESPLPSQSHIPAVSPVPMESFIPVKSPIPVESLVLTESPIPIESPVPSKSPIPFECVSTVKSPIPVESPVPAETPLPEESAMIIESSVIRTSPTIVPEDFVKIETTVKSPIPAETLEPTDQSAQIEATVQVTTFADEFNLHTERVESAIVAHSPVPEASNGPAPDVVPDESAEHAHPSHSELVTDIDIGIPESHAQEICVPVTSEIHLDETVQPPSATTPPPTPAVEPAPTTVNEAPLVVDPVAPAAAAAGVAAAGAVVAGAVLATKTKTAAPAKKSPTTPTAKLDTRSPKTAPKTSTTPRSTVTAKKTETARPTSASTRLSATKTPTAATKPLTPTTKTATATSKSTTPASKPSTPLVKSTTPVGRTTSAAKPATSATKTTITSSKSTTHAAATANRIGAPKPGSPTTKPTVRETTTTARAAPKSAAAPRPAAPRPVPKVAPAPRPTTAPARATSAATTATKPAPAKLKPKVADKPLTNGDTKESKPATKPAPRPAAGRPALRAPAVAAPAVPKSASNKPAPRATAPLDKQSKDLANKRITAKTAPPRTALTKTGSGAKNTGMKPVPKKVESSAREQSVKCVSKVSNVSIVSNGEVSPVKSPPSPAAPDNALLPDVIA